MPQLNGDNTSHTVRTQRSEGSLHGVVSLRCCDCKYYFAMKSQCRRYPPAFAGVMRDSLNLWADFPEVLPTKDWCGEFSQANAEVSDGLKGNNET